MSGSRAGSQVLVGLLVSCSLASCARIDNPPESTTSTMCGGGAEESRWAATGGYRTTAEYRSDAGQTLWRVIGLAASDSLVYVYDGPNHRVDILDLHLRRRGSFGRSGDGPGEFGGQSKGLYPPDPNDRRVDVAGDSVIVFSGDRVQVFSSSGGYRGQIAARALRSDALSLRTMRIRYADGALYYGRHTYRYGRDLDERGVLSVERAGPSGSPSAFRLSVTPLPTSGGPKGPTLLGREQARPSWDLSGGCVVATDGAEGRLVLGAPGAAKPETIRFAIPRVALPKVDDSSAGMLGMASRGQLGRDLKPTAPRRIDALIVDPDGHAWLLPYQETDAVAGRLVVLRVSLSTGVAMVDTVPVFPREFGEPGVFYGVGSTEADEPVVYRVEAGDR